MKRSDAGFTLVEMLIVIAIFGFVLAGTSQMFISMLRTHRQQSRIAETNIEGIIGLELLRQDLEKAGYGLPWNVPSGGTFNYAEKDPNTYNLNDGPANPAGAANPPRGIESANNVVSVSGILAGTDYLVIKAANVATNSACAKWNFLPETGVPIPWPPQSENLSGTDRVIVISPGTPALPTARTLITGGTQYNAVAAFAAPVSSPETRVVYGIDPDTSLRMPFNRADYFVMQPGASDMPKRCATGTGILYKAVVNQNGGGLSYMPLLDCVADMQIAFRLDRDGDGVMESTTNVLTDNVTGLQLTAAETRTQVKEVRVYILAHEGQQDINYTHPVNSIYVGGDPTIGNSLGRGFDLTTIANWQNYRWRIYTLVVRLNNLN